MSGMKRFVAANKRESGASLDEGKNAMSFEMYKILCEEMYNGKGDDREVTTVSIYMCSTSSGGRIF